MSVVLGVKDLRTDLNPVQRRLSEIQLLVRDQIAHVPEEKREQQRTDVVTIAVGIHHQDDLIVAQPTNVEIGAQPRAERLDEIFDLLAFQNFARRQ